MIFVGSDGGLQRSDNANAVNPADITFTKTLNNSLSFTQAVGLAINPTDSGKMYIGTQDNGSIRRVSGTMWKEFSGGDGGQLVLDPLDSSNVVISYVLGSLTRFEANGTGNQYGIHDTFVAPRRSLFYPPLTTNGVDSTLYFGADTLEICTNCMTVQGIGNWTSAAGGAALTRNENDVISAIAVQRTAFNSGTHVHNGNVPMDNPGRFVSSVKIDPANPATAYITVSGFGTNHVFKSTNFGATVTPLGFTVDIPTSDFLIDPLTATTFYIATDIGVFRSTDSGATWNQNNEGMPPVVVNQLASAPDGRIAAATFGRGVYTAAVAAPTAAGVSVSGRVLSQRGRGISGAAIKVTNQRGSSRTVRTNSFGYYNLTDLAAGQTYVFSVTAKGYQFAPQVTTLNENLEQLNFTAR